MEYQKDNNCILSFWHYEGGMSCRNASNLAFMGGGDHGLQISENWDQGGRMQISDVGKIVKNYPVYRGNFQLEMYFDY